jgi:hypothetical protein
VSEGSQHFRHRSPHPPLPPPRESTGGRRAGAVAPQEAGARGGVPCVGEEDVAAALLRALRRPAQGSHGCVS